MQCERCKARNELAKLLGLEPYSPIVNHEIEDIAENLQHVEKFLALNLYGPHC